ncbi:MAG: carbon monoxide dehydrogenase, partial [Betaproteobacteria bacterium]|nr:carbon monoxide dehydrogenase [Betaproteobacteria bacterium]
MRNEEFMMSMAYHRPSSIADASSLAAAHSDGRLLAGGQSLLPAIRLGLSDPTDLIDLGRIPELKGIHEEGESLRIGAMCTHAEVASSDTVKRLIPALAHLAEHIGDRAVRNRGTLGGSLANNDPAACYPAAVLGLGATIHTNHRDIAGDDFFTAEVFEHRPEMRVLVKWGIGMDAIDHQAAAAHSVVVQNTPAVFGEEVADSAFGYLLSLARGHHLVDAAIRNGGWPKYEGVSLAGQTLGVIGHGSIG